jgi:hypothetical protein
MEAREGKLVIEGVAMRGSVFVRRAAAFVSTVGLAAVVATPASGQTASGAFIADPGGSITPKTSAAYIVRDQFNPREREMEIVLSTAPVNVAAAAAELSPHMAIINDPALSGTNYVLLWIKSGGRVSMNATFGKTMTQFLDRTDGGGTLKAELTINTPEKVAGRIFTTSPVKTMDGATYRVDLTFSTTVAASPAGSPLAKGGGEPGKALDAFLLARQKGDWPSLKAALSPTMAKMFVKDYNSEKENLTDMLQTLDFWLPARGVAITGGQLSADTAVLDVEGTLASGIKALSLVRMLKDPSGWRFDQAVLAGMLP